MGLLAHITTSHDKYNDRHYVMKWALVCYDTFSFYDISFLLLINLIFNNQPVGYTYFHTIAFTLVPCYKYLAIVILEHDHISPSIVFYFYNSPFLHITMCLRTTMNYLIAQPTVYKMDLYDSHTLASQLLSFDYIHCFVLKSSLRPPPF